MSWFLWSFPPRIHSGFNGEGYLSIGGEYYHGFPVTVFDIKKNEEGQAEFQLLCQGLGVGTMCFGSAVWFNADSIPVVSVLATQFPLIYLS